MHFLMLWVRALLFSVLVPGVLAVLVPQDLAGSGALHSGWAAGGWLLIAGGAAIYIRCLLSFVAARGTPAIFFTRPLSALLGKEPSELVRGDLYQWTRNPMYLGVLAVIFGQAIVFRSVSVALYGSFLAVSFHFVVVLLEEPHLRRRSPALFDEYCKTTPRWLGIPGRGLR